MTNETAKIAEGHLADCKAHEQAAIQIAYASNDESLADVTEQLVSAITRLRQHLQDNQND